MSQKYTDARYPEKINDLIDNEGNVNPEIIPPAPTPEPGLKLYKHCVTFEGGDSGGIRYNFLSNYSEPFTNGDLYYVRDALYHPSVLSSNQKAYFIIYLGGVQETVSNYSPSAVYSQTFCPISNIIIGVSYPGASVRLLLRAADTIDITTGDVIHGTSSTINFDSWFDTVEELKN